jgi:hypothetical protein
MHMSAEYLIPDAELLELFEQAALEAAVAAMLRGDD